MMAGTHSHGQGHATTYAQIVADELGLSPEKVQVREGDTDWFRTDRGTFASRSIVSAGARWQGRRPCSSRRSAGSPLTSSRHLWRTSS